MPTYIISHASEDHPRTASRGAVDLFKRSRVGRVVEHPILRTVELEYISPNMPAVTSGTILVTGGTGYIGAWIVKFLVAHGFHVLAAYVLYTFLNMSL